MFKRKIGTHFVLAGALCLVIITMSCATQTRPFTSKKLTNELLNIHAGICPRIPFDMDRSKIVFFSDLHRGMGETDVFQKNKMLFEKILNYYFEMGYTLVFNGDVEEGWGYQRSNIPLILDHHRNQIEIEKKFLKANRYYRVYGNHDDFYRGQLMALDADTFVRVYPALIFEQILENGEKFVIFSTHGCQGHGLHDAGDDVAAWGVSLKYLWLLEFPQKKFRSEEKAIEHMEAVKADYDKHERYMLEWAFGDSSHPKCQVFIGGHTHRVVFESAFDSKILSVMKKDFEEGRFRLISEREEGEERLQNIPFKGSKDRQIRKMDLFEQKVIEKLKSMESDAEPSIRISDGSKKDVTFSPFYFNSGCAFFSVIPCIEISDGKIRLVYICMGDSGRPVFDIKREGDLKKYLSSN